MVSLSEIAVISFVNHFGSRATAAYGAVNQIVSYVQFPAISIGIASSIFGAQAIGGRRLDRLGPIARSAVGLNYAIGGVLIAICYAFSWPLLGLFLTDQPTLSIARQLLMITLWSYLIFGNNAVLSGIMRSSGAVLWPTLLAVVSIWGVEVPAAYLLDAARRPRRHLDRLSDRVRREPLLPVDLLLRLLEEAPDQGARLTEKRPGPEPGSASQYEVDER